eukprot:365214-Chlamydomonas_euryale.AAC.9
MSAHHQRTVRYHTRHVKGTHGRPRGWGDAAGRCGRKSPEDEAVRRFPVAGRARCGKGIRFSGHAHLVCPLSAPFAPARRRIAVGGGLVSVPDHLPAPLVVVVVVAGRRRVDRERRALRAVLGAGGAVGQRVARRGEARHHVSARAAVRPRQRHRVLGQRVQPGVQRSSRAAAHRGAQAARRGCAADVHVRICAAAAGVPLRRRAAEHRLCGGDRGGVTRERHVKRDALAQGALGARDGRGAEV